ncbi:MFS general substrate transporter [Sporormia fimetaria CBS 119925]|uniref:MFS general substrate transporter n=1 Tax=Sporormia fimetaria CBS 119925 TaxID=1340428 RepID=A0A6A6UV96_9PLEO|nr:MFS general substrate transporter [Sporormia fimetaria CBS 119925]
MGIVHSLLFTAVCAVSHLMAQAALGQALMPVNYIARDLHVTAMEEKSWFSAAYSLTVGTFILISGRLGDLFGHKQVYTVGWIWLAVWSGFAGFSGYTHSQVFFDICRAMQGVGPALLMPNALALLGLQYVDGSKEKNFAFAAFGALAPSGFVIGATFGSLFAQKAFDWGGSVAIVTGMAIFNIAYNNSAVYGWDKHHVYTLAVLGCLILIGAYYIERGAEKPLIPVKQMDRTTGIVLALVGLGWAAFGIWVFYSVLFLQGVRHETPLLVSAQFTPAVIAGLVAAGLTGYLLTHTPISFVMLVSMVAFCVGCVVACVQPAHQKYFSSMFVSILIMPFGMDMSFPAAAVILSDHMPREHQGTAASLVNTVVNYSISCALGIAGIVERYHHTDDGAQATKNALYTATGFAGLGVAMGALFFVYDWRNIRNEGNEETGENEENEETGENEGNRGNEGTEENEGNRGNQGTEENEGNRGNEEIV